MCVVNDSNPRRRHRPAYLAPARSRPDLPLMGVAVPEGVAGAAIPQHIDINIATPPEEPGTEKVTFPQIMASLYRGLVDLLLLTMVMIMSFFLYDVEITIVKSEQAPPSRYSDVRGSRVVWRNEPIIETPPSSVTRRGFDDSVV
mmetsp:Transcript_2903/g.4693  ORF Transcript_2903/g.4693 Transcript_2903/m.4693 type:complete len:144 (-) Transcript_2903:107-538(-)|eukprot:CAMPEP_0119009928 /NCGR_PEP_ID=MMETSP1176-20130426/4684_1 /TAXON_ID=265551 /ORGANISM="Synedropsis recta cf, Strain CCMP1620" /LENGTH=143 /DNA_ID=CAMNT_0006962513 /DNA_START=187 /DNA_END=618 /DNA_ORIENTATION=-